MSGPDPTDIHAGGSARQRVRVIQAVETGRHDSNNAAHARRITAHVATRWPGDPAVLKADSIRIPNEPGWKPRYERLDDIIRTAWAWHRKEAHSHAQVSA